MWKGEEVNFGLWKTELNRELSSFWKTILDEN